MSFVSEQLSATVAQLNAGVQHMAVTFGSALKWAHEFAGVAAFLGALVVGAGFTISPPWATHADVSAIRTSGDETRHLIEKVQQQQDNQIKNSEKQTCIILQLLRDRYEKEQNDAQAELNKTPTSPTLQRARDEAKANVEYLDSEQRNARCRHLQAPISSFTGPNRTGEPRTTVPLIHSIKLRVRPTQGSRTAI